jgi:glycosyltransferase involved in cell wall biosynthesis
MISIVCPFYNEKENLEELYTRLLKAAGQLPDTWELVFVNDCSTDSGGEFLKSIVRDHSSVQILDLEYNTGLTTALYAGLEAAKGDILGTLDADLQNPPEEIPRLFALLKDADMVTGIRKRRQDDWLRRFSSKTANGIRKSVLGDHIQDVGCSLRVFRRPLLQAFYPYKGMHRFFPAVAEAQGFKIIQVPVDHQPRLRGKAKYGFWNRLLGPLWDLFSVKWLMTRKIHYKIKKQ